VNNESTELNEQLNAWPPDPTDTSTAIDLFPAELQDTIRDKIGWIYAINNGVYRCGFASTQKDYLDAAEALQTRMNEVEQYLATNSTKFLVSDQITVVDIRLFNTLIRMDEVYVVYFKCHFAGLLMAAKGVGELQYPNMLKHLARVYHCCDGTLKNSIHMDDIVKHYYCSHMQRNMYGVYPKRLGIEDVLEKMAGC